MFVPVFFCFVKSGSIFIKNRHIGTMVFLNHLIHVSCWHIFQSWSLLSFTTQFPLQAKYRLKLCDYMDKDKCQPQNERAHDSSKTDLIENENLCGATVVYTELFLFSGGRSWILWLTKCYLMKREAEVFILLCHWSSSLPFE